MYASHTYMLFFIIPLNCTVVFLVKKQKQKQSALTLLVVAMHGLLIILSISKTHVDFTEF